MVVLLGLVACGEPQQSTTRGEVRERDNVPTVEAAPPRFSHPLISPDGAFLDVRDVAVQGAQLLVLTGKPEEVWELSLQAPRVLRRIAEPRKFGQASVRAMAAHSRGLSFLGLDGRLRLMSREDPAVLARTVRAFAPMMRPVALGEQEDGQWVAVHAHIAVSDATAYADSVIVSTVSASEQVTRIFAMERVGPGRPGMLFRDRITGRVLNGVAVLAGSEPVRVIRISSSAIRIDTLLGAPERPMPDSELQKLRKRLQDARTPQVAREAPLPLLLSAAVAAIPFAGGMLVVAEAGVETFAADLYCGRTFKKTVLSRSTLSSIFVTPGGLVAIDEPDSEGADAPARLSFYPLDDFLSECAK